ncbi:MAG TPA: prepilin-type cleavage/methylation domain-containing protein [Janthinobacterium sp.]|nr:prepilin-type cleavage/methylation domain-containing protein [Janthinobacterium sp.]
MFQLRGGGGFTLIEMLLVMAVIGIMLAIGVPMMSAWSLSNKAAAASGMYMEGFQLARQQALSHNAASRIVLSPLADGRLNWQVDLCFPTSAVPCSDASGGWSTTTTAADGDPQAGTAFTSVLRTADALPSADVLQPILVPEGSTSIYFTSQGWVNTAVAKRLVQIKLVPTANYSQIPASAVVVNLAGTASKCNPDAAIVAADSRYCSP